MQGWSFSETADLNFPRTGLLAETLAAQDRTTVAACASRHRLVNQETLQRSSRYAANGLQKTRAIVGVVLKKVTQSPGEEFIWNEQEHGQSVEQGFADAKAHRGLARFHDSNLKAAPSLDTAGGHWVMLGDPMIPT